MAENCHHNKNMCGAVFVGFRMAFDIINNFFLNSNLGRVRVNVNILVTFFGFFFFSNRKQVVSHNKYLSQTLNV